MWSAKKKENNITYSFVVLEWNAMNCISEISALNIRNATKIKAHQISININQIIANSLMEIFVDCQSNKYSSIQILCRSTS